MRPTPRLIALGGGLLPIAVAVAFVPALSGVLGVSLWLVALAAGFDALQLWRRAAVQVERVLPRALSLGEWASIELTLTASRAQRVQVFDDVPDGLVHEGLPATLRLRAHRGLALTYQVRPTRRGELRFGAPWLERYGPWGLWCAVDRPPAASVVRVYPSFRNVARYASLALGQRAQQQGVHLRRRRGQGLEFHQLRDYREGDSLGQVDWKSVARRQQLISRDYREEQNQRVIFALDCGRRMRAADGEHTLFDQALNALLLLGYVALRQGDAVGVVTFSGARRYLPPVRGAGGLTRLLAAVYDLESSTAPSDYAEASARLNARQQKRALIVVLTNLGDDDTSELADALAPLRRKHLVLVASLRDPALRLPLEAQITTADQALTAMSTWAYLGARRGTREVLRSRGIRSLDAEPAELPASLVRQYMDIKRAGLL